MRERAPDRRAVPAGYPHGPAAALAGAAAAESLADPARIVLVEGVSDQIALDTLARRLRTPRSSGLAVVPVGGAQGLQRMLRTIQLRHSGVPLAGLYDVGEAHVVRHALQDAGLLTSSGAIEDAGFFACRADLEDELVRACGPALVQECLARNADLAAFRKLQKQPQWRDRPVDAQLRRWIASGARRKLRYARILVDAVPRERIPPPLLAALG